MRRRVIWAAVIAFLAALSVGTISNVVRQNAISARVQDQAAAGQAGLDRQCRLLPVGRKLYADALQRGKITTDDFELVVSTANVACARP